MKKLKPGIDPVALMKAVKQCDGDVCSSLKRF